MTRVVHVNTETQRMVVGRSRLQRIAESVLRAEGVRSAELSITFVSNVRMAAINWKHLGHRGSTDVISFGFAPVGNVEVLTGDIYIAPAVAKKNASEQGVGVREEIVRLVIHGVLHVAGHDHPAGDARYKSPMWTRQERLLRRVLAAS